QRRRRDCRNLGRPRLRVRIGQRDLPHLAAAGSHRARARRAHASETDAADRSEGLRLRRIARAPAAGGTKIVAINPLGQPVGDAVPGWTARPRPPRDRKSTRLNSSHVAISYAVFCLKKKKKNEHAAYITRTHQY